ncbi:ABC transporter permease [Streptosporangium sp. NPDC006930]|uniref:ABC transporter permease n=1 Tax=unclassified Streptosporangium TaxID=2632669 RepID=UPI00343CE00C
MTVQTTDKKFPVEPEKPAGRRRESTVAGRLVTKNRLLGVAGVALFLAVWQLVWSLGLVEPMFFAGPVDVVRELVRLFASGEIWPDIEVTSIEFFLGMVISIVLGVVVGIFYGASEKVHAVLSPLILGWNATPQIALVPVLTLWFGIGTTSKVVIVVLSCIAIIILNTATGIKTREARHIRLAKSYNANQWQLAWSVSLPHALPYIVTGVRLAIGRGLIAVVVAELLSSRAGLGNRLAKASSNFDIAQLFAVVIITATMGILLAALATRTERKLAAWRA